MDQRRGRERPDLTETASPPVRGVRSLALSPHFLWHLVSLGAGAVFLMYVNRGQWFSGDEWDFLTDRTVTIGNDGIFEPHNEHWSTGPILLYGLLFRLAGLESYAPYIALVVLAHLAVVHLAWRVMLRGGVTPWVATAICAAFIPFGPGAENLLWAFQVGFVGSVGLGLGAILLADHAEPFGRRDAAVWGLSVLGLTFSGISLPLVGGAAAVAWMRRGLRDAVLTAAVPAAIYLLWLATAGRRGLGTIPPVTADSLRVFPQFLGRELSATLSLGTHTLATGAIPVTLGIVAVWLRRRRGRPLPAAALGAVVGGVLLWLMLAVARAPLGLEAADESRYVYIGVALLLPLMVIGVCETARARHVTFMLVGPLAAVWMIHNANLLLREATLQAERERLLREQIVAAGTLFDRGSVLRDIPDPVYTPDLDLDEVHLLLSGLRQGVEPSHEAIARASLALQVSVTSRPELTAPFPVSLISPVRTSIRDVPAGCVEARSADTEARVALPTGPIGTLRLEPADPLALEMFLSAAGLPPEYVNSAEIPVGKPSYLNVAVGTDVVGPTDLILRFHGRLHICPLRPVAQAEGMDESVGSA